MLNADEEKVLKGALGLWRARKPYRKHYRAPASGPHREMVEAMATKGLLEQDDRLLEFFYVTEAGAAAMGHALPSD